MTIRFALAAAVLALASAGCHDQTADEAAIVGIEWRLDSIERPRGPALAAAGRNYTLLLGTDGRASVRSDCNSCGGGYTLAGSSLAVTPLACTRVYCGEESLDPIYPAILQGARSWSLQGDRRLVVVAADGNLLFVR
jgi:heat shock protein HslJ